ncbi:ATP synthase F1, delta subunit [Gleimia coleocanis DSM 15436]|uniref:ATP synthase subunit delta n=1 Tax=Gleimia coleocanis DSM 15436 TaxID=525245 RepID=C0W002_9ACTO|nr:F0F1 ATP synthase subunit delta [Gleimia coleocanis]EEH63861.1 ATP synthase F1, delta subunit [Gleimia coleocanis DSM 15436]
MRAASEKSLKAASAVLNRLLSETDADVMTVAENLFGLSDLSQDNSSVRNALTDPGRSSDDKRTLTRNLLGDNVLPQTVSVVEELASGNWSSPEDLNEAFETLGTEAVFIAAEKAGKLADVEEELFRVNTFLADQRELRIGLSDLGVGSPHDRAHFAARLFGEALNVYTTRLVRRAVRLSVHGRLLSRLRYLSDLASQRRQQVPAVVTVAQPLTEVQRQRLLANLEKRTGKNVILHEVVEPEVLGGFHILVGNQAINATVSSNLEQAKRALA